MPSIVHDRRAPLWAGLVTLVLLLSGCVGSGGSPQTTLPTASRATLTSDTGGIEGRVIDDEAVPIAGADVGIQGANNSVMKTDVNGRFAFSQLTPGEYRLVAQTLGHKAVAKKVDVLVGEITYVNLTLEPVPIGPSFEPNELTPSRNTLYLHIKSAAPRYWLDTEVKNSSANSQVGGYNPLGFVIGSERGAATWVIPMNPLLPRDVSLDKSKPVDIVLFIGGCLDGIDSGYITVTTELKSGEVSIVKGAEKTSDYKGNLVEMKWSETPAVDTITAEGGLTWHVRAVGAGSQICLGAYSEALSHFVLPIVG